MKNGKTVENQGGGPRENAWKICNTVIFLVFHFFRWRAVFPPGKTRFPSLETTGVVPSYPGGQSPHSPRGMRFIVLGGSAHAPRGNRLRSLGVRGEDPQGYEAGPFSIADANLLRFFIKFALMVV